MSSEAGSFRDPDSQVHRVDGRIIRVLTAQGRAGYDRLRTSGVLDRLIEDGLVVPTAELALQGLDIDAPAGVEGWDLALEHDIVPMISYAHEWSFEQLRAAALTHLEVVERALGCGVTTADGSTANVQFDGPRPAFIDVGSFVPARPGQPWPGYRQFCRQFLFPLLLSARIGVSHRPWLRGDPEGPTPTDTARLLARRRLHDRDVLTHVRLHAWAEGKMSGPGGEVEAAAGDIDLQTPVVRKLRQSIEKLPTSDLASVWDGYGERSHYERAGLEAKERFVAEVLAAQTPTRVVDLGANDGRFSLLASAAGAFVAAIDADEVVVGSLWERERARAGSTVLPLAADLSDPDPTAGWRGKERPALLDRSRPDLVLALAVLHHLVISANLPLTSVVEWLASIGAPVILEVPHRDDPMVQQLLAAKDRPDSFRYDLTAVEHDLTAVSFTVAHRLELPGATRTLFHLEWGQTPISQ
ncbi:MAG: methyltransferase [Actinomycetia bacterium]|nr:methyltransferase [Actinomycetes bacterium]